MIETLQICENIWRFSKIFNLLDLIKLDTLLDRFKDKYVHIFSYNESLSKIKYLKN